MEKGVGQPDSGVPIVHTLGTSMLENCGKTHEGEWWCLMISSPKIEVKRGKKKGSL
jgi:hypothetical protein